MDLTHLISQEDLINRRLSIKKVFFYRICGTGMGAAACLMKEAGFEVDGADSSYSPPMSDYLKSTGIPLYNLEVVTEKFLKNYDLIIVGNSVAKSAEGARVIERSGVPFTSFPSCIGALVLREANVVGIAGTHGKTTTTYFLTQLLDNLGQNPGYLVGGIIDGHPPSKLGNPKYFVIESDEYDSAYFHKVSKFRFYELKNLILTSLEFDHADIFESIEKIEEEFEAIMPQLPNTCVMNLDYKSAKKLFSKYASNHSGKWFSYGDESESGPHDIKLSSSGSEFRIKVKNQDYQFKSNVVGKHNVLNLSSALIYLLLEGFSFEKLKAACADLKMVKRRQEVRGSYKESIVIDDFAHHPRAITVTTEAIKSAYPDKKIITIFEPISATARSSIFQKEFAESLSFSDVVIIAKPSLTTTAKNGKDLDTELLINDIQGNNKKAFLAQDLSTLRKLIDEFAAPNHLFLILSNRTCLGLWESDFVQALS